MERYLKRKEKLYILLIILATIVVQLIFYAIADSFGYRAHLLTPGLVDNFIKFNTVFVYPYLIWYAMLIFVPYIIGLNDEKQFKKYILAVLIAAVVALVIFIVYPTIMERPELIIKTFSDRLLSYSYAVSTPTKSAPSVHVILSTLFILATVTSKEFRWSYKTIILIISLLIIVSTMFVKQHYFVDVVSGLLVGFLAWLLANIRLKKGNKK